ncbi:hypothetical protein PV413_03200 [Streptomyces scabiei]|uniref:hypothetical protein n=1 Tax=Streptomyces scabiei TaxID=1930 RepID=UPI001B316DBD|nr:MULTISPECIES: hypothetical protein [Streptomyces]MDX2749652.1 hypothetical protein [Streptomyces scabiei]MDX3026713.1 hypothetical protein [Streptomyces scabiei]MDX3146480.1 hypothetical protein [Streptomyces scabiei]MDX3196886.1 hypothetical protein [Streptomyces scabiei]MDX3208057.1 hypothetical protein [Streptomyces scabiei]
MSTPPAVLPHRDAVRAALEAAPLVVGLGRAPDPVPADRMYVVLYFTPGQAVSESLADARTDFDCMFQVTCVAPTEERCLWLADKVRRALHAPVAVTGRTTWRPEDLGGPPMQRDDDVSPPLFYVPIQYHLKSTS